MEIEHGHYLKRSYGLLVALVVLQAVVIGLVVHFQNQSALRDRTVLERTDTMVNEVFPEMRKDLSDVSQKTSEIKGDVSKLRLQVSKVGERVGDVGRGVIGVGRQVESLDHNVTDFVQDKSGLVWGHSLNPYILLALLAAIALSIPLWGWAFLRFRRNSEFLQVGAKVATHRSLAATFNKLGLLIDKIRGEQDKQPIQTSELQKLKETTERLIEDTKAELAVLSHSTQPHPDEVERNPENLH